jgi:hypothetical protein
METWTKLYASILDSSVWFESKETKILWVTFLAKKDENGFVRGNLKSMAAYSGLTDDECAGALKVLESPDKDSRTKEHQGRRIKRVDGGWNVVNHFVYRDEIGKEALREYWRRKKAESLRRKADKVGETPRERAFVEAEKKGDQAEADRIAAMQSPSELSGNAG